VVVGDTDFGSDEIASLDNHGDRPEVMEALHGRIGTARRPSPSRGEDALYVAVPAPLGVARVSMPVFAITTVIEAARRTTAIGVALALLLALAAAAGIVRALTRPLVELRDAARAIARGDYSQPPLFDSEDELGDVALSLRELSSQLTAQDKARRGYEVLLEQISESLNEGVLGITPERRVARINETGRRLLGTRDTLPFSVNLLPRDRVLHDALDAAFAGRIVEGSETVVNGRTVNITARPLESGGVVLALLDLTRIRQLEAVRRDFVANASHELRTPLTIVSGFAETLLDENIDADGRRRFAERILANTRRMQRIVDDLLDLSRLDSGGWVPIEEDVDLASVAAEAIGQAGDAAAAKGIGISSDIRDDARMLRADATAIRQVLGNLVDNAVRHTSRGSVTIFASRLPDGAVEFGVRDTGSGIAPEHLTRIFERFYRVDPGRSRQEGGTGLGLAIVRLLVTAHGGNVRAESVVGHGATVIVEFPAGARD